MSTGIGSSGETTLPDGVGVGAFGGAGVFALYGLGILLAAAILEVAQIKESIKR